MSADDIDADLEYLRDFDPQTADEIPAGTRYCVYVTGTEIGPGGGHVPSVVYENVSGHFPLRGQGTGASPWEWGDYDTATKIATEHNARLGLTRQDVLEIVASSFRKHFEQGKDQS